MSIATNVQTATDPDWDTVDDVVTITVAHKGAQVDVAIADGDQQLNKLQRNVGDAANPTWRDIKVWTAVAANAVVAYTYTTQRDNEELRVIMQTDGGGGGSKVTSITELNRVVKTKTDDRGRIYMQFHENGEVEFPLTTALDVLAPMNAVVAGSLFTGRVRKEVVAVTAAVAAADSPAHAGKLITFNALAGFIYELPAATGSGDTYEFIVITTNTSVAYVIECTEGAAMFIGQITCADDASGISSIPDMNSNDFINMNGGTTGGELGSWCRIVDAAVDVWNVNGHFRAAATEATPFADA